MLDIVLPARSAALTLRGVDPPGACEPYSLHVVARGPLRLVRRTGESLAPVRGYRPLPRALVGPRSTGHRGRSKRRSCNRWAAVRHPFGVSPEPYANALPSNFPDYYKIVE